MSLFNALAGSLLNNAGEAPAQGGLNDLLGALASGDGDGLAMLLPLASQLLDDSGPLGGIPGLVAKFQQAGLGDVLASWLGTGPNASIAPEQLQQVLGGEVVQHLSGLLGVEGGALTGQLAALLPGLVDSLPKAGAEGGADNAAQLLGALGGLFGKA